MNEKNTTIHGVRDLVPLVNALRFEEERDEDERFSVDGKPFGSLCLVRKRRRDRLMGINAGPIILKNENILLDQAVQSTRNELQHLTSTPATKPLFERWIGSLREAAVQMAAAGTEMPAPLRFLSIEDELHALLGRAAGTDRLSKAIAAGTLSEETLYALLTATEITNHTAQNRLLVFLETHWDELLEKVIQHFIQQMPGFETLIRQRVQLRADFIHFKVKDFLTLMDEDAIKVAGTWSVLGGEMMLSSSLFKKDTKNLESTILHELLHAVSCVLADIHVLEGETPSDEPLPGTYDDLVSAASDYRRDEFFLEYDVKAVGLHRKGFSWLNEGYTEGSVVEMCPGRENGIYKDERFLVSHLSSSPLVRRTLPFAYLELKNSDEGHEDLQRACSSDFGHNALNSMEAVVRKHKPAGAVSIVRGFHGEQARLAEYLKAHL